MDSETEEVIFVQEKRKYRKKKGCVAPKKCRKPSSKIEAAAKTTRKYTKKSLLKKEVNVIIKTDVPPKKSGPLLLPNFLKEVVPIRATLIKNNFTFRGVNQTPPSCSHCCVHQQMMHHHHHHPPPPPLPLNFYPHPFRSQMKKPSTVTSSYPGKAFPFYRKVFDEDPEYTQELETLLFTCGNWSLSKISSSSDLWQPEGNLQRLLSEYGLDEASPLNAATPSFRHIFDRTDNIVRDAFD